MGKKQEVLDAFSKALSIAQGEDVTCTISDDGYWVTVKYGGSGFTQRVNVAMDSSAAMMRDILDRLFTL